MRADHDVRYGHRHRRLRAQLKALVESGEASCARCGQPIRPGEAWDLDHDGDNPTAYLGVSHARCNRRTNVREPEPAVTFRERTDGYFEADGLFYRRGLGSDSLVRVSRPW